MEQLSAQLEKSIAMAEAERALYEAAALDESKWSAAHKASAQAEEFRRRAARELGGLEGPAPSEGASRRRLRSLYVDALDAALTAARRASTCLMIDDVALAPPEEPRRPALTNVPVRSLAGPADACGRAVGEAVCALCDAVLARQLEVRDEATRRDVDAILRRGFLDVARAVAADRDARAERCLRALAAEYETKIAALNAELRTLQNDAIP